VYKKEWLIPKFFKVHKELMANKLSHIFLINMDKAFYFAKIAKNIFSFNTFIAEAKKFAIFQFC